MGFGESLWIARAAWCAKGAQQVELSQRQLEVLDALQAAPTGIVLLDQLGRIAWSNQVAAGHFGFDMARDQMQSISNLVRDPEFHSYMAAQVYTHGVVLQARAVHR